MFHFWEQIGNKKKKIAICVTPTEWKNSGKCPVFTGFYLMEFKVVMCLLIGV